MQHMKVSFHSGMIINLSVACLLESIITQAYPCMCILSSPYDLHAELEYAAVTSIGFTHCYSLFFAAMLDTRDAPYCLLPWRNMVLAERWNT